MLQLHLSDKKFIAYQGATYIRGFMVHHIYQPCHTSMSVVIDRYWKTRMTTIKTLYPQELHTALHSTYSLYLKLDNTENFTLSYSTQLTYCWWVMHMMGRYNSMFLIVRYRTGNTSHCINQRICRSHVHLIQGYLFVNWDLRNKLHGNMNQNIHIQTRRLNISTAK